MYFKESSLEKQVFIGPFLGPFLALLTMSIALFNYSPQQMELPLAGLVGIYCSWKWRIRGAAIAWVLLAAVTAFKTISSPESSMWWNIALAASIGLASLVTALTQRNVRDHLEWKYQDAVEQQSRLAIVEGRLNTILQTVNQERAEAQSVIDGLRAQLQETAASQENLTNYVNAARDEINTTRSENERLHSDIVLTRQEALKSQEELEEANQSLAALRAREEAFNKQEEEMRELRHTLGAFQHQIASYKDDLHRLRQQQALNQEMGELIETLTREKSLLESTLTNLQKELEGLRDKEANNEINVDESSPAEVRRLEGFYRQLREQFEEKSRTLDETRRELFQTQEKLNAAELEFSERELASPQISLEEHVRHLAKMEEELKQELELSHQEIKRLYNLVESITKK